jgi:soluble lytic murein transglycosylase-like protein
MQLSRHALRELDAIPTPPAANGAAQLLLLEAYADVDRYDRVFTMSGVSRPDRSTPPGHPLDRFLYPLAYWDVIRAHAETTGVDPFLVVALIRQESLFAARAVSPKGARGLMQLMPDTSARLARKVGRSVPEARDLERPEVNIAFGMAYLQELFERYGVDQIHKVLAAYNAGERAVTKWERRFPAVGPDEFVERISYRETRDYVKAVLANRRLYRLLYERPRSVPAAAGPGEPHSDAGIPRS